MNAEILPSILPTLNYRRLLVWGKTT